MYDLIRTTDAETALSDTATAFASGTSPLAAWGADELRLDDGSSLVVGIRRSSDGGELVGCWRLFHLGSRGIIAGYNLDVHGLVRVK